MSNDNDSNLISTAARMSAISYSLSEEAIRQLTVSPQTISTGNITPARIDEPTCWEPSIDSDRIVMPHIMSARGTTRIHPHEISVDFANTDSLQTVTVLPRNEAELIEAHRNLVQEVERQETPVVTDEDILHKTLEIQCQSGRRDFAKFEYKKGKIEIKIREGGSVARFQLNIQKEKEKIQKLIKNVKIKKENDGRIRNMEDDVFTIQKNSLRFKLEFRYSDETLIKVRDEVGRICYVIASNQDIYKLAKFLEKTIKIGGIKMSSLLKINCIEEENDNVEVLDCNDGQNVAIKTDSDGEVGMIFMSPEDAVKMAKEILKQYEK